MFLLDEIYEEFEDLDPRDQSQYLLELGYDLPRLKDSEKRSEDLVEGCQSQVWLRARNASATQIDFEADSDAEIVRGLIAILLASYSGKSPEDILAFPVTDAFDRLKLNQYISPQRKNGLNGMVNRIRDIAARYAGYHSPIPEATTSPKVDSPKQPTQKFDVATIKAQFPVLNQTFDDGLKPVYLDSGASAQKPSAVIEKEREVQEQYFANAYRGKYRFGARIDEELEESRSKVAAFINARESREIAFVGGTTAALNMIAFGWGGRHLKAGDEVLISHMEHHANLVPWQQVVEKAGATLRFIPLTEDGRLNMDRLDEVLTPQTKIVAISGMSNVLGTINPIDKLTQKAHAVGAIIVVDGAQSVPHMKTDVQKSDVDFLVFSGHKVYGPTGVGVLYGKAERLEETDPILFGGHMISKVTDHESSWSPIPARFEAGTLPIVQAIALGAAIDWINEVGIEAIGEHEHRLLEQATQRLSEIEGMTIFGPDTSQKGAIISFRCEGVHPEDLAAILDRRAVLTRHGHHCTMPLHNLLGVSATTRASFGAYNTIDDIDALIAGIKDARKQLKRT